MPFQHLEVEIQGPIATLWLNRPDVRNALDEVLLAEITQAVTELERNVAVRVLVLAGRGKVFCAGADLNWMKRMASYSDAQNQADAMGLATMLKTVHGASKPVIARVHGHAFAGGMGLAAACDVIVAEPTAEFCLSEVRIGLIPSTISPYILQALGTQAAKRYMLTAERLGAQEAHRLGFVQALSEPGGIDHSVAQIAQALIAGGPSALARTKALIDAVANRALDDELVTETAGLIASVRASSEGREGVASFLEKRRPAWLIKQGDRPRHEHPHLQRHVCPGGTDQRQGNRASVHRLQHRNQRAGGQCRPAPGGVLRWGANGWRSFIPARSRRWPITPAAPGGCVLRARNASGEHPFETSDAQFDLISSYFVAPADDEGFDVVRYRTP